MPPGMAALPASGSPASCRPQDRRHPAGLRIAGILPASGSPASCRPLPASMPPGMAALPASGSPASCRPLPASMPPGMAALPVALPAQDRRHLAVFCGTASMPPGMAALRWRRSRPSGSPASCRPLPASMPPGMAALPVALGLRIAGILPALAGFHAARDGGAPRWRSRPQDRRHLAGPCWPCRQGWRRSRCGVPGLRIAGILPALAGDPCRQGWRRSRWRSRPQDRRHPAVCHRPLCRRDGGAPGGVPGLRIAGIL